jgi:hypothetical protein
MQNLGAIGGAVGFIGLASLIGCFDGGRGESDEVATASSAARRKPKQDAGPNDAGAVEASPFVDSGSDGSLCPLPSYPTAACTGVPPGTSLTVVTGDITVTTADTVIEGKDIRGCVIARAPGLVIRRTKITGCVYSHDGYTGAGVLIEDSDIGCNDARGSTAVGDTNVTVRRSNIHNCENGFDVDGNLTIEDSYIHDLLPYDPLTDPHTDGLQITPVGHDITIRHNTILVPGGTSAVIAPRVTDGVVSNVLIRDNLVAGGSYTLYCQQNGRGNDFRVIGNHFSTMYSAKVGEYGPWTDCEDETEVTGNVYHETGLPVPF